MVAPCVLIGFSLLFSADGVPVVGVTRIDIPHRDNGYKTFDTLVLQSQDEFDKFMNQAKQNRNWNERDEFTAAIEEAKVDFAKESLVLVRHTEGSGSIRVRFRLSEGRDDTVAVNIFRECPSALTADMAYYCYAFKVQRAKVRSVTVRPHADNTLGIVPNLNTLPKK